MAITRSLRTASMAGPASKPREQALKTPPVGTAFKLALVAVTLHFFVSANLMQIFGINYNVAGGNPLTKFHPATYIIILAAISAMRARSGIQNSLIRLLAEAPSYIAFIGGMLLCVLFALMNVGTRGALIFIENYISAGLLLYVLEVSSPRSRSILGKTMIALCLANVIVAIGENSLHIHLIPPYLGDIKLIETDTDFRGTAGFDHPLIGALAVMMGLLCLLGTKLPALVMVPSFAILCVGLLAFGGRTAVVISAVAVIGISISFVVRGLVIRRVETKPLLAITFGAIVVPLASYFILTHTPVGGRLLAHFYVDDSAQVRSMQWHVLQMLSLPEMFFGVSDDRIFSLIFSMGLDANFSAFEDPWLVTFLTLGAVGSAIFVVALAPFIIRLWRLSTLWGRIILICGLLVISSFDSLGRKSNVLFLMTAFVAASRGFATAGETSPVETERTKVATHPRIGFRTQNLMVAASDVRSAGLRVRN